MNKHELYEQLLDTLLNETTDLRERLEIIANLLVGISSPYIHTESTPLNPNNYLELLLEDRRKNGETIANAVALQGYLMLDWLRRENE